MIVTKAGYQIRRSLTQWDYEIITLEVSQQLEQESPTDGRDMLQYAKQLVIDYFSPVQAGQKPVIENVPVQRLYVPNPGTQTAPAGGNGGYRGPARSGGPKGPPRHSQGQYAYKLPYPTNEAWKQQCKQSGGGWDGVDKLWKSNTLLLGAEEYLVSGPSGGEQQGIPNPDDTIPW